MLARMAWLNGPSRKTTRSPLPMSVATMDSGSGKSSMLRSPWLARTSWFRKSLIFCPVTTPVWYLTPSVITPLSEPGR